MRNIAAIFGIAAVAAVVFSALPTAAFGFHLGPFYFHFPFGHHYYRHHLYSRANPNEARAETNTEALESCTSLAPGVTNLPIDQIRQSVNPTPDQEAALENLSAASSQASEIIKSSCPAEVPLTPIGRLDTAERRLNANIKAIGIVRSPLERFYEALTDEQMGRFNAMNDSAKGPRSPIDMTALCSQQAGSFIDLPAQRIVHVVQPTVQQQSAFDDLKKAAQNASDQLQSSCPTTMPKSPVVRLDTAETLLSAMVDAS